MDPERVVRCRGLTRDVCRGSIDYHGFFMKFNVLTIFPDMINDYAKQSILGRGQISGALDIKATDVRDFSINKHKQVDDTPYGGGPGMVLRADVMHDALQSLGVLRKEGKRKKEKKRKVILMSPRGTQFDQSRAEEFSKLDELVIISGRYEGIDQRVIDFMIDEEISVGPYVLAGGELPALTIIEATARNVEGVLGNPDSLKEETHSSSNAEYPQYTRPEKFKGMKVPDVLLSGHHGQIESWRRQQSK